MRALLLRLMPWWDQRAEAERLAEYQRIHRRAIDTRMRAEAVAERYRRFDRALRRQRPARR